MHKSYSLLIVLFIMSISLFGQLGGKSTYEFINLPLSARIASQGGILNTIPGDDINLAFQNPGLLNPAMHNKLAVNAVSYFTNINYGFLGYGRYFDSLDITFGTGLQYIYYGNFLEAKPSGEIIGSFDAGEYAFNISTAKQQGRFSYGANVKVIYSQLESYRSLGMAMDVGGIYYDTANRFSFGGVIKNIGKQLKPYREGNTEPLPFDMQIGFSKRLAHVPFRLSVTYHHLQKFNIRYDDPNKIESSSLFDTGEAEKEKKYIVDKIFRHIIFGGEIYFSKNFSVMIGYNHLRRKELSTEGRRGFTGFSFGAGITIKKFRITYGRATYHVAGSTNHLSVSTSLSRFFNVESIQK